MVFNPEDEQDFGPHCRNCHKGSSRCSACHNTSGTGKVTYDRTIGADNTKDKSSYSMGQTSIAGPTLNRDNLLANSFPGSESTTMTAAVASTYAFFKKSQTVNWDTDWRNDDTKYELADVQAICGDDGFSWPHRTLGWKMLKDDLFGLNFDGTSVAVGGGRFDGTDTRTAHDLDSVCLDCHNPTVWNATGPTHVDTPGSSTDNHNDELLTRGLP